MALSVSTIDYFDLLVRFATRDSGSVLAVISYLYGYFFHPPISTAKGVIAIILSPQLATAGCIIATLILFLVLFLALLYPDIRKMLTAAVAGALTGGIVAVVFFSPSTSAANGANAFAWAGGAAETIEGGIAIAIGKGACAKAVNDIVLAIGFEVVTGLTVGGIIGLMVYLACRFSCKSANERRKYNTWIYYRILHIPHCL